MVPGLQLRAGLGPQTAPRLLLACGNARLQAGSGTIVAKQIKVQSVKFDLQLPLGFDLQYGHI